MNKSGTIFLAFAVLFLGLSFYSLFSLPTIPYSSDFNKKSLISLKDIVVFDDIVPSNTASTETACENRPVKAFQLSKLPVIGHPENFRTNYLIHSSFGQKIKNLIAKPSLFTTYRNLRI